MLRALLANVDAIGIAPAQIDDRWRHQAIVEHDISLLHQAQGTKSQQVRVARASAYQINLAQRARRCTGKLLRQ